MLIKEKEGLIKTLNNRNSIYIWFILFLIICSGLFIYIIFENRKKIKRYEKHAKDLLEKIDHRKIIITENEPFNTRKQDEEEIKNSITSHPKFQTLIHKIEVFEKNQDFLRKNITLDSLSKEFDTNRDYLSKLINELKGKNFTQYLNELRIN